MVWIQHYVVLLFVEPEPRLQTNFCKSFSDNPVNESAVAPIGNDLFDKEQEDIPKKACDRWVSYHVLYFWIPIKCRVSLWMSLFSCEG
jgi:hypothetical protein